MNNSDINLALATKKRSRGIRRSFLASLVFFFVVFIGTIAVLLYNLSLTGQLSNLSGLSLELKQKINGMTGKKLKILQLQDRISYIQKALADRNKIDEKVAYILSLSPDDLVVSDLDFNQDSVKITYESDNLFGLDGLTETISSGKNIKFAKQIQLISLSRDKQTGNYTADLEFTF